MFGANPRAEAGWLVSGRPSSGKVFTSANTPVGEARSVRSTSGSRDSSESSLAHEQGHWRWLDPVLDVVLERRAEADLEAHRAALEMEPGRVVADASPPSRGGRRSAPRTRAPPSARSSRVAPGAPRLSVRPMRLKISPGRSSRSCCRFRSISAATGASARSARALGRISCLRSVAWPEYRRAGRAEIVVSTDTAAENPAAQRASARAASSTGSGSGSSRRSSPGVSQA